MFIECENHDTVNPALSIDQFSSQMPSLSSTALVFDSPCTAIIGAYKLQAPMIDVKERKYALQQVVSSESTPENKKDLLT